LNVVVYRPPQGWQFKTITEADIPEINNTWKREGGDYLDYINSSIKSKESLGAVDEKGVLQAMLFGIDFGKSCCNSSK